MLYLLNGVFSDVQRAVMTRLLAQNVLDVKDEAAQRRRLTMIMPPNGDEYEGSL